MNKSRPKFDRILHVGRPNVGNLDLFYDLTKKIFKSRWFTNNGSITQEFENQLCNYLGVRHCIPVCNATVGLQIAYHAMELQGEVIIPAFTFVATAHALQWERIKPVFADIDPETHNLDTDKIEQLITRKTTGIVGVHIWGRPCNPEKIQSIADKYGLKVLFDAAHAFGCKHNELMIGNFGQCEVFSFHATKYFNTFEGGAIATNDDHLAEKIRLMKNFGFAGMDNVINIGTNGKMPEICAAMGLACFDKLDDTLSVNKSNYEIYCEYLQDIPGIQIVKYDLMGTNNYQYVVIEVDKEKFNISRDELMKILHSENIRARRYFYPGCHRMEPYLSLYPTQSARLPNTDRLCDRVLVLPSGISVGYKDIKDICNIIGNAAK